MGSEMASEMANINDLIREARARYNAMSPEQRAAHDYEQRRSFVRAMCPSHRDYDDWCKAVDHILPPLDDALSIEKKLMELGAIRPVKDRR